MSTMCLCQNDWQVLQGKLQYLERAMPMNSQTHLNKDCVNGISYIPHCMYQSLKDIEWILIRVEWKMIIQQILDVHTILLLHSSKFLFILQGKLGQFSIQLKPSCFNEITSLICKLTRFSNGTKYLSYTHLYRQNFWRVYNFERYTCKVGHSVY